MKLILKSVVIRSYKYRRSLTCNLLLIVLMSTMNFADGQQRYVSNFVTDTGFRAAVIKVDITPEDSQMLLGYGSRKSIGVHDRIFHRILVLDDGLTRFVLVSSDICEISPSEYDRVASKLNDQFNIDPSNFWWTVTHTHSAPEVGPPGLGAIFLGDRFEHKTDTNYTIQVEQRLINGVNEASRKLVPARLGSGWGFSQANINRRARDIDNTVTLGLNPDGAVDRRIGLLRIDNKDGSPIALIANYPIHGTVLNGENLEISGDAPGIVSEYVELKIGAPLLFINGAEGNLAPIYSVYPNPRKGHLGQFRVLLGDKILEANKKIVTTTGKVILNARSQYIETPIKPGIEWTPSLGNYIRITSTGARVIRIPIRFLKINDDIIIWSAPLELFCEISNEIRGSSPFPYTFYFGLTNGWLGYMLPESEFNYGGYELEVSPFTIGAAKDLTDAVAGFLEGEMKNSVH